MSIDLDPKFSIYLKDLEVKKNALVQSKCIASKKDLPPNKTKGVYYFAENNVPLYVGRSNDIKDRYGRHCNQGATDNQAAFAFKLAREATGFVDASYKSGPFTRKGLMKNPDFIKAFNKAKSRLREMEFRFVVENDPLKQCLLEIYCATCLNAKYNDFDNH
ncbi:MAG: hypothetical protein ABJG88_02020 [Litorimonas sp.]